MIKKILLTLFIVITLVLGGSVCVQAQSPKETVDEAAVKRAQEIRERALKMKEKASSKSERRKADKLLTKAADMETNAHKLGNKCKHGSHYSVETVKKNHQNCEACHEVDIKDGECARVPGDHKHYYCYCNC
jgi:ABC-type transporter MlaC component